MNACGTATGEIIANMTVEEVQKAVSQEEEREKCIKQGRTCSHSTQDETNAHHFLRAVRTSCRAMGQTQEVAEYAWRKCFALQYHLRMYSFFLTINPDDECSF